MIKNYALRIKKFSLRFETFLIILFGLSVCISESLSRNIVRIIFIMAAFKIFLNRDIAAELLKHYKNLLIMISAFAWWMIISSIYGGRLVTSDDSNIYWFFFSHNMLLFIPLILIIRRQKKSGKVLIATAISLLIDDLFIFYQVSQGVARPETFLGGSWMQGTMIYVILLPMLLIMSLENFDDARKKIFFRATFLLSLAAFILLNTRGAWIDLSIVLTLILIYRIRNLKKLLAIFSASIIAVGIFLTLTPNTSQRIQTMAHLESEQAVTERFLMWQSAINMIKDHPIMGVGLGNYVKQYQEVYILPEALERQQTHAHNAYLHFWAETGIFGLALFCAIFIYTLRWAWARSENLYGQILFFSTLALMIYGITDYTFAGYSAMRLYWLLFGVCVACLHR